MRAFLLAGAAIVATMAIPAPAEAQKFPPGSYIHSCQITAINTAKGTMDALCDGDTSTWEYLGAAINPVIYVQGKIVEAMVGSGNSGANNIGFQYSDCAGGIDNIDGHLRCLVDQAKVAARLQKEAEAQAAADASAAAKAKAEADRQYKLEAAAQVAAATPGLRAAGALILGQDLGNEDIQKLVGVARALSYPESRPAVLAKEFDFGAASAFLKKYLARSGGERYRNSAIDAAFVQVYGRPSTAAEQIGYYSKISAGTAWYATIVGDESKNIAAGAPIRAELAQRVAQWGLGRDPTAAELQQWTASNQNFGTMVEGVRQRLWNGSPDELVPTVQRALTKLGRPSDDAAVKTAVAAWRPMRPTYAQMIGPVGKSKLTPTFLPGLKLFGN